MMNIEKLYKIFKDSSGITTDTRNIKESNLFFALKGDNFNGNEFADKSIKLSNYYAVIDEGKYQIEGRTILVDNVLDTLQRLANFHRKQLNIPVIGITGSNGKTTTKELIFSVLNRKYNTIATQGNLNNHIGVPLSLLRVTEEHEMAIIEMGANHQKEIEFLCSIAEPDFGMITNIGKAHLDGFGGVEGVIKGKGEMYDFIRNHNRKIFINMDDPILNDISKGIDKISYGSLKDLDFTGCLIESKSEFIKLQFEKEDKVFECQTNLIGEYNFNNVLVAACIGDYFEVSIDEIIKGIESYRPDNKRSELKTSSRNNQLILDAYNANPSSMEVAIKNFINSKSNNKFFVIGNMLELGAYSKEEHLKTLNMLIDNNLKGVLIGEEFIKLNQSHYPVYKNAEELIDSNELDKISDTKILIKGSRGNKLEKVEPYL